MGDTKVYVITFIFLVWTSFMDTLGCLAYATRNSYILHTTFFQ